MPSIALPVSLRGQLLSGVRSAVAVFSPIDLFATGSQGIWLDPSDLSTMFSDRAGTTPVTTPGTVVGLRLDKSKGLVLGAELVVNGDFASSSNWAALTGTLKISGGALTVALGDRVYQTGVLPSGSPTVLLADVSLAAGGATTGNVLVLVGTVSYRFTYSATSAAGGRIQFRSNDVSDTTAISVKQVSGEVVVDNVSVKQLPGNHAVAPTDAARPIYGVEPKGGRRNLLMQTESFGDIAWTKTSLTVSGNQVSYAGGLGGTKECVQLVTVPGGTASKVLTAYVTVSGSGTFRLKNTHSGVLDNFSANVTATGTRQTIALTVTNSASAGNGLQAISIINSTGDAAFSLTVHEFQLELGSTATAYQRVTTAYDITESGVATCHYVQYDGSDDSMSTSAIDFTATDKMSVFAGVRKLSDAATAMIVESSTDSGATNGSFRLLIPAAAGYEYRQRGTINAPGAAVSSGYASPISNIITGLGDISGDLLTLRINGIQVAQSTADQGSSAFGNYPLFFGRRNNASNSFNGRDFGIIIVGKAASAGEISDTETWLAAKTSGVTL